MSSTACTFSGLASIPRLDTTKPRNFPKDTPKVHLEGFSFIPYRLSVWNVSAKLMICLVACMLYTSISSM
jgi:hypothetical protein